MAGTGTYIRFQYPREFGRKRIYTLSGVKELIRNKCQEIVNEK